MAARKLAVVSEGTELKAPRKATKATVKSKVVVRYKRIKLTAPQVGSMAVGTAAVALMGLSIVHIAEAIATVTPLGRTLSFMFAVGIDFGMVAQETGELLGHGTARQKRIEWWTRAGVGISVALSMALNGYVNYLHMKGKDNAEIILAVALGIIIPGLVYMLGKSAAHLWLADEKV